ncbi:HDOD domain-containing protein [Dickeya dadantii]|uniref:HDOD domain-containing protein n=1 Tax=Dickeya dadantii TaxID=204038 RepID=UPI0013725182|nr:HDOD domain-containing protein [Dickeya dadantii]NAT76153.1 response regulator [Dickeya dadantii]NPE62156.1 HDOD domain-containing protein [Dickeya dadantii]
MQVMFVDDESRVLSGIERALMMQDTEWECRFANSGQEALAMLEEKPADVVVSDMRMPFMDGAELLTQVRDRWPGTIRIILSGYSEPDATVRMVDVAHRFVSKPCDSTVLLEMVGSALALRDMFQDPAVVEIVGRTSRLPAAPNVFIEVCRLIANPGSDTRHIAELLGSDPALSAKIMQLANSAYFARGGRINDIGNAITHLGLDQVQLLVLASQVFADAKLDPYVGRLQQRALLASTLAASISGHQGLEPTAALLANIALLIPELRESDNEATTTRDNTPIHAAVGAYLLALWGLPMDIVEVVACQTHPSRSADKTFGAIGAVHVAVALANNSAPDLDYLEQTGVLNKLPQWQEMLAHTQETLDD